MIALAAERNQTKEHNNNELQNKIRTMDNKSDISPTLSIIIATFNSGKILRRALDSVLNQSYQNWECVIVDGASKDNTLEIVKEYEERDSRFRHISEPDHGIYEAFNKGWKLAKGEWVHYLGSDDKLTEDGFSQLFKQDLNAEAIGGGVYLVREGERPKPQYTHGFGGCHQGFIMKKSLIEKLGGFNERYKILADADLMTRATASKVPVKDYRILIAYFTIGGVSQTLSNLYSRSKERYSILRETHYTDTPLLNCCLWYIRSILVYIKHKVYKVK